MLRIALLIGFLGVLFMIPKSSSTSEWKLAKNAEKYLPLLRAAEIKYALPPDLLARMAYQESRFRDDIVSGATVSSAGAVGLMQIVPRWHPGVNPLNVPQAIDYAARYVRQLRTQFGSWQLALAAYNFGPGNVSKGAPWPAETRNYVTDITRDLQNAVPLTERSLYA